MKESYAESPSETTLSIPKTSLSVLHYNRVSDEADSMCLQHTAIEHALFDERSTNPANSGIDATSTPLAIRASVTLNSAGSKSLAKAAANAV